MTIIFFAHQPHTYRSRWSRGYDPPLGLSQLNWEGCSVRVTGGTFLFAVFARILFFVICPDNLIKASISYCAHMFIECFFPHDVKVRCLGHRWDRSFFWT